MSIKVMTHVWEKSKAKGSALLLLLAIADFANDKGGGVWAGIDTLAKKIRMDRRQTRRLLRVLEEMGELKILERATPVHHTNSYTITLRGQVDPWVAQTPPDGTLGPPPDGTPRPPNTSVEPSVRSTHIAGDKTARSPDGLFDAITDTCQIDPKTAGSSIGKVRATLAKAGYSPQDVLDFKKWWWGTKNMRQRPPSVWELREKIGVVRQVSTMTAPYVEPFVSPRDRVYLDDHPKTAAPSDSRDQDTPGF